MGEALRQVKRKVRQDVSKLVLLCLAEGAICMVAQLDPRTFKLLGSPKEWNRLKRKSVLQAIQRLKRYKMVAIGTRDGKDAVIITEYGKKRVLAYKLDEMKISRPRKWDGRWHIVSFDIPERYKRARNMLAAQLRKLGMIRFNKSVYIHPYECKDEVDFIKEVYNVGPFVSYFIAEALDGEERLLRYFRGILRM